MSGVMFTDTFYLDKIDWDHVKKRKEKKFDKVSRIDAKSENYDTEIVLDINTEIYPLAEGTKFEILLADRLQQDIADSSELSGYDPNLVPDDRAKSFEYIMYGKIFKYAEEKSRAVVYASFGGLLMSLRGESRILTSHAFRVDSEVYLFMRKV